MKVIFIKDLKKQGKVNDVKEVSDGYAVNFLIKNGYAVKYTKTSNDILKKDLKDIEIKKSNDIKEANALKDKIEKITLKFKLKSNNGKVFGSISSKQICEELLKYDIKIDKKCIKLDNNISTLGVTNVICNLYKGVDANIKVMVADK